MAIVLDASVVIALRAATDPHHERAVSVLSAHESDELVLPASAYAETLVEPAARGREAMARARRFVEAIPVRIEPVTREIAERAAELRKQVRLPDALVLATSDLIDAEAVLTTDRRWSRVNRRVKII